jgi:hypothetical protein
MQSVAMSQQFHRMLGIFHGCWTSTELYTDYAICKFLNVSPKQGHLITTGMPFSRRAKLLVELIKSSRHPNKSELIRSFNVIRSSKREAIAHGYISVMGDRVSFLDRHHGDRLTGEQILFTLPEFYLHVKTLTQAAEDFESALGADDASVARFANAALSRSRKSRTSPKRPTSRAR